MSTNVTAKFSGPHRGGSNAETSQTVNSVPDQTVNTTPNSTGGWNTAVVTADLARQLVFTAADGVRPGTYEKCAPGVFRLNVN